MSAQVNIAKSSEHIAPPTDKLGYGFNANGQPGMINTDGSFTIFLIGDLNPTNLLANKGVGLAADLPSVFGQNDVYVSTDTFKVYVGIDDVSYNMSDLVKSQIITDTSKNPSLGYQYTGSSVVLSSVSSIIANKGIGIDADKPVTGLTIDDIYVSNDTFIKYTAISTTEWNSGIGLTNNQFVTDAISEPNKLYQFDGTSLNLAGGISDLSVSRVNPIVVAGVLNIDFESKEIAIANKTINSVNSANAERDYVFISIIGDERVITLPSVTIFNESDSRWNNTAKTLTLPIGLYLLKRVYDGTNQYLELLPEESENLRSFRTIDLDNPDSSIINLKIAEQYFKTCGTNHQFSIINESLKFFKLILIGGSLSDALFTHATKNITVVYEGGGLEQYDPLLVNRFYIGAEEISDTDIKLTLTISNANNAGYYGEFRSLDLELDTIIDLHQAEEFIKTCGTNQQLTLKNELNKFFDLILTGGSLHETLFLHATKTVSVIWENGVLEQYETSETNRLYCKVETITDTTITITASLVNPSNQYLDFADEVHAATSKPTPIDADELGLVDSAANWIVKKLTFANLKATLKTYFDTFYTNYWTKVENNLSYIIGNVGFGTTTPTHKAEISNISTGEGEVFLRVSKGYASAAASRKAGIIIGATGSDNTDNTWRIVADSQLGYMNSANLDFIWRSLSTDYPRIRVTTTGNFLLNTTIDSGYNLDINGTGRYKGIVKLEKGSYSPYVALTFASSLTWDCSTGLNKTLDCTGDFTLILSNKLNGMSGDLRLNVTAVTTITLPTSKLNGSVTALAIGIYHLAWVYDGTNLEFNIGLYA